MGKPIWHKHEQTTVRKADLAEDLVNEAAARIGADSHRQNLFRLSKRVVAISDLYPCTRSESMNSGEGMIVAGVAFEPVTDPDGNFRRRRNGNPVSGYLEIEGHG